jgi:hypothetical protein
MSYIFSLPEMLLTFTAFTIMKNSSYRRGARKHFHKGYPLFVFQSLKHARNSRGDSFLKKKIKENYISFFSLEKGFCVLDYHIDNR